MVEQKAKDAGFDNAIPEQTVAYKTRTKAAPKKSIKVYQKINKLIADPKECDDL